MESKRELYKQRGRKGLADRGVRVKLREESSRSKRENLLLSKRRIPLAAIQEDEKEPKSSLKEKQLDRLEKLKEWKKQRETVKKEAAKKKAKPFVCRATSVAFNFGIDKAASGEKLSKIVATPGENRGKPTTVSVSKLALGSKAPSAAKTPSLPRELAPSCSKWNPKPSVSQATKSTPKESVLARGPQRPKTRSSARIAAVKQEAKPVASTRSSVSSADSRRVATSSSKNSAKSKTSAVNQRKPAPTAAEKSAVKKTAVPTSSRSSARVAAREKPESSKATRKPKKSAGFKKPNSSKKTLERVPIDHKSESSDSGSKSSSSAVPTGNTISPEPVRPSPVVRPSINYISVRPTSQVQSVAFPFVNDPAWIPNAKVQAYSANPNFSEAFGGSPFSSFSPFQFSGALKQCKRSDDTPQKPFAFTFRKSISNTPSALLKQSLQTAKLNMSSDSLADGSVIGSAPGTPTNYQDVRRSIQNLSQLTLSAGRVIHESKDSLIIEVVPDPELELRMERDTVSEPDPPASPIEDQKQNTADTSMEAPGQSSMELPEQGATPGPTEEGEPGIDFAYFRGLHSGATEKLTSLCQVWEGKNSSLEAADAEEEVTEEVLGQIRTAVCQAHLLMCQKLKQYLGLVEEAESRSGDHPNTAEDLQGFWDMVYFQVEDLLSKFEDLAELESNNWRQATKRQKKKRGKKRAAATAPKSPVAASGVENDRQRAAREKREAARNKLREMKAAAKRAREGEGEGADTEGELVIELPKSPKTKRSKEDPENQRRSAKRKSLRSTPSKYRRASAALINLEDVLQDDPPALSPSRPLPSSVFSPPLASSGRCARDVPTAQLLSFTPGKAPKTPLKTPAKDEGAFQRMYISITPSKRIKDLLDADVIMSPARRSLRLAGRGVKCATEKFAVSSIMEMPQDVDFAYCPNRALL